VASNRHGRGVFFVVEKENDLDSEAMARCATSTVSSCYSSDSRSTQIDEDADRLLTVNQASGTASCHHKTRQSRVQKTLYPAAVRLT
jgi:hypothetical protein